MRNQGKGVFYFYTHSLPMRYAMIMKRKFGRNFFVVVLSLLGICAALFSWFFAMSASSLNYDRNAYAGNSADINVMYISRLNHDNVLHATIEITNIVDKKVSVRVTAYNKDGLSLGDVTGITRLNPSETKSIDAHALPTGAETLKIKSNGGIVCNVVFRTTDGKKSEVVPAIIEPSRQLDFPALVSYNDLYIYETITLFNPNTTHARVDVVALDKNGYEIDRNALPSLSSMESKTFSLMDIFGPRILKDLSTVRVNSDSNIIGLQLVDYPEVDLVGLPALTTISKGWMFPIATKGENFDLWTKVGILNPGNDIANVAVEAFDASNNSLGIIHRETLLPGG